jgi:hypothetical protein
VKPVLATLDPMIVKKHPSIAEPLAQELFEQLSIFKVLAAAIIDEYLVRHRSDTIASDVVKLLASMHRDLNCTQKIQSMCSGGVEALSSSPTTGSEHIPRKQRLRIFTFCKTSRYPINGLPRRKLAANGDSAIVLNVAANRQSITRGRGRNIQSN